MNHVVLMPYLSNSLSRRGAPTSPANMPWREGALADACHTLHIHRLTREMSPGESSPPYEPSLVGGETRFDCEPGGVLVQPCQLTTLRQHRRRLRMRLGYVEAWFLYSRDDACELDVVDERNGDEDEDEDEDGDE